MLNTDVGQVFNTWSDIEYTYYKSMTKDENWCSIIRQKINNLYTIYFDKEVILGKEYMDLIKTPKRLYYKWVSGGEMDADDLTNVIDDAINKSQEVRSTLQKEKMLLSWSKYKKLVEGYLRGCFDNCKLIDKYEDKTKINNKLDFLTEDHFYAGYICRSLNGYLKNYQKSYYSIRRGHGNKYFRCNQCGIIVEKINEHDHSSKYCANCKKEKRQQINHSYYIKTKQKS